MKSYTRGKLSSLLREFTMWYAPEDAVKEYMRIYNSLPDDKKFILQRLSGLEHRVEEEGGWRASPELLKRVSEDYERLGL